MRRFKKLILLLLIVIVSACSQQNVKNVDSAFYAVPVGSSLSLNQDVTIAANQVAVYMQNGQIMKEADVDKYYPNCKFELYKISESPRVVMVDTFEVIKVVDDIEASFVSERVYVASRESTLAFGLLGRSQVLNYVTLIYLRSEKQKDVFRISCQHWEDTLDDMHLSINQMRTAMGNIFTLSVKQ